MNFLQILELNVIHYLTKQWKEQTTMTILRNVVYQVYFNNTYVKSQQNKIKKHTANVNTATKII
jgi:hypothetical protein